MIKYTSVDRILSIINRELGEANVFSDDDLVEWIGEAMEFLSVFPTLEESITILEVKDYKAGVPSNLVNVLQLAKIDKEELLLEYEKTNTLVLDSSSCESDGDSFRYSYESWVKFCEKESNITPIRLADHTFFNSLVCKETRYKELYKSSKDEYSIIGNINKEFLFSFKEGTVALSYLKMATDSHTGYPLIPDHADFISAVTYYVKWKISEAMTWRGREGSSQMLQYARGEWLRYVRQAKNWAKMPKTIDELQNFLEQSYSMVPDLRMYYKGFNNLNRLQQWR